MNTRSGQARERGRADQAQLASYRRMGFAAKWDEMLKLRRMAWDIKRAGVKMLHPRWTARQVEKEVREMFLHART